MATDLDENILGEIAGIVMVRDDGDLLPQRSTLNFIGFDVTDDPINKRTNIVVTDIVGDNDLGNTNIITDGYIRLGDNAATSGILRLQNDQYIVSRNAANTGNYSLIGLDSNDILQLGALVSDNQLNGGLIFSSTNVTTTPFTVDTSGGSHHTHLMVNTLSSAMTINLQASSALTTGRGVLITDYKGNAGVNNITIVRPSGKKINGLASNFTIKDGYGGVFAVCDVDGNYNLFGTTNLGSSLNFIEGTSLTSTSTETGTLSIYGCPPVTVLANKTKVGDKYRFTFQHRFVRGATATALGLGYVIIIGGSSISLSGTSTTTAGTYYAWCECEITFTAIGSSGTFMGALKVSSNANTVTQLFEGTTSTSVNTATNMNLSANVSMNNTVAGCSISSLGGHITKIV